jgi:hypothetical protein
MARRLDKTLADYVTIAISPVLIMAMVGSLMFYLLAVAYGGEYSERLTWILSCFVVAIVLIARISIEEGKERAGLFAVALGFAVGLAIMRFVNSAPIVWVVMGVVWWASHKLTFDCTLIDEEEDASGEGLLQAVGLDDGVEAAESQSLSAAPLSTAAHGRRTPSDQNGAHDAAPPNPRKKRKRGSAPGTWVIYFSLAALPLFGLGQWLVPAADAMGRRRIFLLLCVYVASGLGLLLTTSFLGLRRYLRQRKLQMPPYMTGVWLSAGAALIVAILFLSAAIPRPNPEYEISSLTGKLGSPLRDASDYASGQENQEQGAAGEPSDSPQGDPQTSSQEQTSPTDSQQGDGSSPGDNSQSNTSENSSSSNQSSPSGDIKASDEQQGPSDRPDDPSAQGQDKSRGEGQQNSESQERRKGQQGRSGESDAGSGSGSSGQKPKQSSGGQSKGQQSQGQQSNSESKSKQSQSGQRQSGTQGDRNRSPQQRQPSPDRSQSPEEQSDEQKNREKQTEQEPREGSFGNESPPPEPPPPTPPSMTSAFEWLSTAVRWAFNLAIVALVIYVLVRYRSEIAAGWRQLIDSLRNFWQRLLGARGDRSPTAEATAEKQKPQRRPFSSYGDPFLTGAAGSAAAEQLVRYSFEALEVWAAEQGLPRPPEETPIEFAERIASAHPRLAEPVLELAALYARVAYARQRLPTTSVDIVRRFWQRIARAGSAQLATSSPDHL